MDFEAQSLYDENVSLRSRLEMAEACLGWARQCSTKLRNLCASTLETALVLRVLASLDDRLNAVRDQGGWSPIETADKGGIQIILHAEGYGVFATYWTGKEWASWCAPVQPTHWMPLPAPPVASPPAASRSDAQGGAI